MVSREIKVVKSKEKIIKVAIEEFAVNGYKSASTNSICKSAKVSKGLLYHYYSTKENLYLSSLRHVIDEFKKNIYVNIDDDNKKGIDYISEYFDAKFDFFKENPMYSKLISTIILDQSIQEGTVLFREFEEYNNELMHEIIKNIETNPKFDKEKAYELILIIGNKLEEKHIKNIENKDKEKAIEEFRKDHKIMTQMVFEGIDK
ncbi:MAG: TetR/AcrR family transcriptional regulator [Peptostreptococcaceae bacterium]